MGYFEGLSSGNFKIAQDGRKLFFPWGAWGRGYVIVTEEEYRRLRQQMKTYAMVSLLLIIVVVISQSYAGLAALVVLLTGFRWAWMRHLLRGLEVAPERLSYQESMTARARTHGPIVLWLSNIGALAFVAGGIWMFIVEPGSRMLAIATISFFGLCVVIITRMLILGRRTPAAEP